VTSYVEKGLFPNIFVSTINEDDESLLVTTSSPEAVVLRFKDGKISPFTFAGQTTPLSKIENYTFTIYRDPAGTLWFGTVPGLFKFAKGGPLAKAFQKQIQFPVTSIFDDLHGSLWLGGRTPGLTRLHLSDGRVTHYTSEAPEHNSQPGGWRARDGRLWFTTRKGVVVIDPKHLVHNDLAPPVVIESV